jgi:hypothetical protein
MTIFRSNAARIVILGLVGACSGTVLPSAHACPDQSLGSSLLLYARDEEEAKRLAQCLTENSVKLSPAAGTNAEVAQAATSACQIQLGVFEAEAGIKRFERGDMNIDAGKEEVRREAERYALSRVVQARAGECKER